MHDCAPFHLLLLLYKVFVLQNKYKYTVYVPEIAGQNVRPP